MYDNEIKIVTKKSMTMKANHSCFVLNKSVCSIARSKYAYSKKKKKKVFSIVYFKS